MAKYGDAAVLATRMLIDGLAEDPRDAWSSAVRSIFPTSRSSQEKGCPKGAFLGLCEEGLVKGAKPSTYTRSVRNKRYAVHAVRLLQSEPSLASDHEMLWLMVVGTQDKKSNSQMDVVTSLWRAGLLNL